MRWEPLKFSLMATVLLIAANAQNNPTKDLPLPKSAALGCMCDSIDDSMKSVAELTAGKTRKDVEHGWREDGGLQSRTRSLYRFSRCEKIKIDVEFEVAPKTPAYGWSADDKVKTVSKPYLELPAFD